MPIYGYRCSKCGHEDDVKQSIADYEAAPIVPTNRCKDLEPCDMKRCIKPPESGVKGFILLGDKHWHNTEYTKYRSIKG